MNTIDFIEQIKKRHGVESDYAVKKLLGLKSSTMSSYRTGRSHFSDEVCVRVAELLELDPSYVLSCIYAERTNNKNIATIWRKAAEKLRGTAAVIVLCAISFQDPTPAIQLLKQCILC